METTIAVGDPSCVAEVRRAVALIGHAVGLSADFVAQVSLITTELCTNILKYAVRGVVTLATHDSDGAVHGLDIVAIDKGPGIANVEAASRDGYSTGGSLGLGLGTIRRAAALFDLHTVPGLGTAIFVRMADKKLPAAGESTFKVGARMVPMRGEHVSGDAWAAVRHGHAWPPLWSTASGTARRRPRRHAPRSPRSTTASPTWARRRRCPWRTRRCCRHAVR